MCIHTPGIRLIGLSPVAFTIATLSGPEVITMIGLSNGPVNDTSAFTAAGGVSAAMLVDSWESKYSSAARLAFSFRQKQAEAAAS